MPFALWLLLCIGIPLAAADADSQGAAAPYAYALERSELLSLARELATRVDLFREIWARDPSAEFYAGTTRDYLYWILGHFRGLKTKAEIEVQKASLLRRSHLKFQEMVGPLSDADIMSHHRNKDRKFKANFLAKLLNA